MPDTTVLPIPCFRDNYAYLLHTPGGEGRCVLVDPSEAEPILRELGRRGLVPAAILLTHHHWDHVGGVLELKRRFPSLDVLAHVSDAARVPGFNQGVVDGELLHLAGIELRAMHVPGHTRGALCYAGMGFALTGDTLFCGGCGRLFEGAAEEMHHSLNVALGALGDETVVYTGHEYTESNLAFALTVDEHNPRLHQRAKEVAARRAAGEYGGAERLEVERATNPFLRCHTAEIRRALGLSVEETDVEVFRKLRAAKDVA